MVGLLKRHSNHHDQVKRLQRLLELPKRKGTEPVKQAVRVNRHLDVHDQQDLVACYRAGATVQEVALHFGINRETVSRVLARQGVDRRYHQMVEVDLDQAAAREADGLNLTAIAAAMGIGRTTLVRARRAARAPIPADSRPSRTQLR